MHPNWILQPSHFPKHLMSLWMVLRPCWKRYKGFLAGLLAWGRIVQRLGPNVLLESRVSCRKKHSLSSQCSWWEFLKGPLLRHATQISWKKIERLTWTSQNLLMRNAREWTWSSRHPKFPRKTSKWLTIQWINWEAKKVDSFREIIRFRRISVMKHHETNLISQLLPQMGASSVPRPPPGIDEGQRWLKSVCHNF